MEENVNQINGGITLNADVCVKNAMYVERIILGILLHVVVKTENIQQVLWTIMCDRIIELYDEETNFNQNKATCKTQNFYI